MPRFFPFILVRCLPAVLHLALVSGFSGCAGKGSDDSLERLARRGYSLSVQEYHRAARAGDTETIREFLQAGMAVDVEDTDGMTALGAASAGDAADTVAELLRTGANVHHVTRDGQTPLLLAAAHASAPVVRHLLAAGAEPSAVDANGRNALAVAAWNRRADAARALCGSAAPEELDTALLLACLQGNLEIVDVLLRGGASVLAEDKDGLQPLMVAAAHGHEQVVERLRESGASRFAIHRATLRTASEFAWEAAREAEARRQSELAASRRNLAARLAMPPADGHESAGWYEDPRDVVLVPPEGPDETMAARIAEGTTRWAQPLAGSTLPAPSDDPLAPIRALRYIEYREIQAPLALFSTRPASRSVTFRWLAGRTDTAEVSLGETIPGTTWKVVGFPPGETPQSPSGVTIEIRPGLLRHAAENQPILLDEPLAVLLSPREDLLLGARVGHEFQTSSAKGPLRVVRVSPEEVEILDSGSGERLSLKRR